MQSMRHVVTTGNPLRGSGMNIETGTVIAGTLRNEDLLEAFSCELDTVRGQSKAHYKLDECILIFEAQNRYYLDDGSDEIEEEVPEIISDLIDALNEYAPEGMYFGTLEGDGADFGWWNIEEVTA
jgi:hypothetical protein